MGVSWVLQEDEFSLECRMARNDSSLTIFFTLILGIAVGGLALVLAAWKTGFLEFNEAGNSARSSAISGIEMITSFTCAKGEKKHIFIRGAEDNFSPNGDETIAPNTAQQTFLEQLPVSSGITADRSYDSVGTDRQLVDDFVLPADIARGLFVTRIRPLGGGGNDYVKLIDTVSNSANTYHLITDYNNDGWIHNGETLYTRLDLPLLTPSADRTTPIKEPDTLIQRLSKALTPTQITLSIGDDHIVDYSGFAVCTRPQFKRGITFQIAQNTNETGPLLGYVRLSCDAPRTGKKCDVYVGNLSCDAQRPLACFREDTLNAPESISKLYTEYWTGGALKFTKPLSANQFETEDDAHAFCASKFGGNYRAADVQDGYQHFTLIAEGSAPEASEVWISQRNQPYTNCWALRDEYGQNASTNTHSNE